MAIDSIRKEDIALDFRDGFAQTELLPGVYPGVKSYRCVLQAGRAAKPETYSRALQVLCITGGKGCIAAGEQVYQIDELSFFIANLEEPFTLHAATELEITKFVVDLTDHDMEVYNDTHVVLPFFRPLSQCTEYYQACKTPGTQSWSVLVGKQLTRILFGVVKSPSGGTIEKGHPAVAQWNVILEDSDLTLTVEEESVVQKTGDFSYVTAGLDHSLVANEGGHLNYIWFEHYVQEKDYIVVNPRS